MNSVAVMMCGHLRTFKKTAHTWEKLRRTHNVDFYFCVWDVMDSTERSWWHPDRKTKHVTDVDLQEVKDTYHPRDIILEPWRVPPKNLNWPDSRVQACQIEEQWFMVKKCLTQIMGEYDWYIRARPDLIIRHLEFDVMKVCNTATAGDALFTCPEAFVEDVVDLQFPRVLDWCKQDQQLIPELIFQKHWVAKGIELKSSLSASICRENGELIYLGE